MNCPCGAAADYGACCGRFIDAGEPVPTAEALMRSRYTAYVGHRADYLLATWHTSTRPAALDLVSEPPTRWLGLQVKRTASLDPEHATVEFVARYKIAGRAYRLHENSRFVREHGRWLYVDGDIHE